MRIAINTRLLLSRYLEGLGNFSWEISKRLVERHPQHDFLFCFDRPYESRFVVGERTQARVVYPPARSPALWWAWFELGLPPVLRNWKADVFLSPDGYCSLRSRVPTVLVTHDLAFLHYPDQVPRGVLRYYKRWTPRFLARAEQVVTVSDFVRQDIAKHYSLPTNQIMVAGNGVREIFRPLVANEIEALRTEYSGGRPYFFYLGAVHPRKNIASLLRAYDRFRDLGGPNYPLLLGGRLAWQLAEVKAAHAASPYHGDIHFLGYLPTAIAARLLAAALGLVYPSLSEGFGVPVLEAMHAEVPIITSATTSLPEVAGAAALLVDPQSEEALADALLRLATDTALGGRLVELGRQQRQRFSWEQATDVIDRAIAKVYLGSNRK